MQLEIELVVDAVILENQFPLLLQRAEGILHVMSRKVGVLQYCFFVAGKHFFFVLFLSFFLFFMMIFIVCDLMVRIMMKMFFDKDDNSDSKNTIGIMNTHIHMCTCK